MCLEPQISQPKPVLKTPPSCTIWPSGPADFKSVPGFENWPRFVGVIEQNNIMQLFLPVMY